MITNEMLLAQSALNGLTDEQRQAIVTLSKNDEETVIGNRYSFTPYAKSPASPNPGTM